VVNNQSTLVGYIQDILQKMSEDAFTDFLTIKMKQEKQVVFNKDVYTKQLTDYRDAISRVISQKQTIDNTNVMEITTEHEMIQAFYSEWKGQLISEEEYKKIVELIKRANDLNALNLRIINSDLTQYKDKLDDRIYAQKILESIDPSLVQKVGKIMCSVERASTLLQNEIDVYGSFPEDVRKANQPNLAPPDAGYDSFMLRFVGDKAFLYAFHMSDFSGNMWPASSVVDANTMTTAYYYFFTKVATGFVDKKQSVVYNGTETMGGKQVGHWVAANLKNHLEYHISQYNDTFFFDRIAL